MISDLLLDVNVVIDICAGRVPFLTDSLRAIDKANRENVRLWLYTGCVQTLEYVMAHEIRRVAMGKASSGDRDCRFPHPSQSRPWHIFAGQAMDGRSI